MDLVNKLKVSFYKIYFKYATNILNCNDLESLIILGHLVHNILEQTCITNGHLVLSIWPANNLKLFSTILLK